MPNKEQLQILIKAKVITEGQAKGLQQLSEQIKVLERQQKSLNKSTAIRTGKLRKLQAEEKAALADTKRRVGGAINGLEALTKIENKYADLKKKQLSVIRANNMALKENKVALAGARTEMQKSQIGLDIAAKKAGVLNQYLLAGGKQAKSFGSSINGAVQKGKVATTFQRISDSVKTAGKHITIFGKRGKETFTSISRTVRRIATTMLTLGSIVLFRNLIRQGIEFEAALIRVAATAKATNEQFKDLVDTVRQVARETIFTASQVSQVAQILAQAGFQVGEIFASLNPILQLAGATMGDLAQTTELVVSIMRAFNLQASQTSDIANVLTEATLSSRANIERLSVAFRFGGPAAASFNQSMETATATLSRFIDLGLSASISGTTLRRALIELSQGSTRQIKVLKVLNLRLDQINPNLNDFGKILETLARTAISSSQAIQLFGARAGASVFALIDRIRQGGESITEFAGKLADAKELNRVTTLFAKISESIRAQSMLARSALEELGISLFNVFRPAIAKLLTSMRERFLELNEELSKTNGKDFSESLKEMVPLINAVLSGFVTLIKIVGALFLAFSNLVSRFSIFATAVQWVTVAIGLLILKTLIFNKTIVATLLLLKGLLVAIGSKMILAMISMGGVAEALVGIMFKLNAAIVATGISLQTFLIATGVGALLVLVSVLPRIVGWLRKKKDATEDATDAQVAYNHEIGVTGEDLKRLSEATLIQIETQERLNELNAKGQVALFNQRSEMVEALKIPVPNTFEALPNFARTAMGDTITSIKGGMEEFAKIAQSRSKMVSEDMGKSLELPKNVQADIIKNYKDTVRKVSRQTSTAAGVISKALKDNLVASKITNPKQAIFFVQNFVEGIRKEANKQGKSVADAMKPITKAIDKNKKTGEFEFTMNTVGAREGFKKFLKGLRIDTKELSEDADKALQNAFANTVIASEAAATSLEGIGEKAARAVEGQFQERFKQLAIQRVATEKLATGISDLLREGGEDAQDEVIKSQTVINEALTETNGRIKQIVDERVRIRDEMANESKEQRFLSQLTLNQLALDLKRENALKRIIGNLVRITVKIEESNALTALGEAKIAMQEKKQAQINEKLGDRQALLEAERDRFLDIGDSLGDILNSFEGIEDILKQDEVTKSFRDEEAALNDINDELDLASSHVRKIKDLEAQLAKIRSNGLQSLQEANDAESSQRNINQELVTESGRLAKEKGLEAKHAEAVSAQKKHLVKILNIESKLTDRINASTKGILEQGRDIVAEQLKLKRSPLAAAGKEIVDQFTQTNHLLDVREGKLKAQLNSVLKAFHIGKATNADILKAQQGLKNINIVREKSLELAELRFEKEKEIQAVQTVGMMADAAQLAGASNLASALKSEFDRREKMRKLRENDVNTLQTVISLQKRIASKEEERIKKIQKVTGLEKDGITYKTKLLRQEIANDDRAVSLLKDRLSFTEQIREERQKSFNIMKTEVEGGFFDRTVQSLKLQTEGWIRSQDAVATYIDGLKEISGIFKSFATKQVSDAIEKGFGLQTKEAKKEADALKKIQDKLNEQLLQNELDYLNKVMEAHIEHRKRMNDINSDFDRERRDVEREIFQERVERMMELAALEQELRSKGLTSEEQRAQLLASIDQNLSSIRIGTIEQRQVKMAELEGQIKALNELENTLGLAQSEIDQGSIARLDMLKTETAAFFNDKQRLAASSIEAERALELDAERARFAEQLLRLQQEKDFADQRAMQEADRAIANIEAAKDENNTLKQLYADMANSLLSSLAELTVAGVASTLKRKTAEEAVAKATGESTDKQILDLLKIIAGQKVATKSAEKSASDQVNATNKVIAAKTTEGVVKKAEAGVSVAMDNLKTVSGKAAAAQDTADSAVQTGNSLKNATGDAGEAGVSLTKDLVKTLGPVGLIAAPVLLGVLFALLAPLIAKIGKFKGGVVGEQGKASGGKILGGHGGIDDIHTSLPAGSYIVNRASTRQHQRELSSMVSGIGSAVTARNNVPVAVTAGEFFVPPGVYRKNAERIDQINRDRSGITAMEMAHSGGRIGLQFGGAVDGGSGPSREVTVNNLFEFSGTNVFGGDEEAVRELYESSLRDLIQQDIDNNALLQQG